MSWSKSYTRALNSLSNNLRTPKKNSSRTWLCCWQNFTRSSSSMEPWSTSTKNFGEFKQTFAKWTHSYKSVAGNGTLPCGTWSIPNIPVSLQLKGGVDCTCGEETEHLRQRLENHGTSYWLWNEQHRILDLLAIKGWRCIRLGKETSGSKIREAII